MRGSPNAGRRLVVLLVVALGAAAGGVEGGEGFMRGMTVSCPGIGRIWGEPAMAQALAELKPLGVRWIAIHPYAGIRRDGGVRFRPAAESGYLEGAVAYVRRAGMELFWKPHLAYWGSFSWRGAIDFGDDPAAWRRFFDDYRNFIVDQARFAAAHDVPLFAVGVELDATAAHEAEWRRIIAAVRRVYGGRLTYAANWSELEQVRFWDALDLIGVQAYFPLSDHARPSRAALEAAWDQRLAELEAFAERHGGKDVLFTEIGYDLSPDAARQPWRRNSQETAEARALRRLLLEVALERLEREPLIRGMFWWKWIPGERRRDLDFSMRHPDAQDALRRTWGAAHQPQQPQRPD